MHVLTLPHPPKQRLSDDRVSGVGRAFSIFKFYVGNKQSPSPWPSWVSGGRGDRAELSDALFGRTNFIFIFFNFLFCIGVWPINNVVIVSDELQRDSAMYPCIHTYSCIHVWDSHVSILPRSPLPSRLPHNFERSFLCYTVGFWWESILNTAVCACPSQTP